MSLIEFKFRFTYIQSFDSCTVSPVPGLILQARAKTCSISIKTESSGMKLELAHIVHMFAFVKGKKIQTMLRLTTDIYLKCPYRRYRHSDALSRFD